MKEFINQLENFLGIIDNVVNEVERNNNFNLIPELMNLLEVIIPNIFSVNNDIVIFNNEDIINILDDIVNAYENNDSVLMTDVLRYGLYENVDKLIKAIKEGNLYE